MRFFNIIIVIALLALALVEAQQGGAAHRARISPKQKALNRRNRLKSWEGFQGLFQKAQSVELKDTKMPTPLHESFSTHKLPKYRLKKQSNKIKDGQSAFKTPDPRLNRVDNHMKTQSVVPLRKIADLPIRNQMVVREWLATLPLYQSNYWTQNATNEAILVQTTDTYLTEFFAFCDHPSTSPHEPACKSLVPRPGVTGNLDGYSQIRDSIYDPTRVVYGWDFPCSPTGADAWQGLNQMSFDPTRNEPGTGYYAPFSIYYKGDARVLAANPNWAEGIFAYDAALAPHGPLNNDYFRNQTWAIPRDSLPIAENVMLEPFFVFPGSGDPGTFDYHPIIEYQSSHDKLVVVLEQQPCSFIWAYAEENWNNWATNIRQVITKVYNYSLPGSGHILSGKVSWKKLNFQPHSMSNAQLMALFAGQPSNNISKFDFFGAKKIFFAPLDAPAEDLEYADLENMDVMLHAFVTGFRGDGEFADERMIGANKNQKYTTWDLLPSTSHGTFAAGAQQSFDASVASGGKNFSYYLCVPGKFPVCPASNRSLDGTLASPPTLAVYVNTETHIRMGCWQEAKNPIWCLYLYQPFNELRLSKYVNPRNSSLPAVVTVVPRVPALSLDVCPEPTPGVCTYTPERSLQENADFRTGMYASDGSSASENSYYIAEITSGHPWNLYFYHDGPTTGYIPVWPLNIILSGHLSNHTQSRWGQFLPQNNPDWGT